jgi:hypothetical protein
MLRLMKSMYILLREFGIDTEIDFNAFFKKNSSEKTFEPIKVGILEMVREEIEEIIKKPRLELTCFSSKNERENFKIIVTPNSINGITKKGDKFIFGKDSDNSKNDYNFPEDTIVNKQFEINYNKGRML